MVTVERSEEALYERARKRVHDLIAFYVHVVVYVVVNAGLWLVDIVTGGGIEWAYWPTIGWGIGLAVHAAMTFLAYGVFAESWRERKEAEYVARMRGPSTKD